MYLSKNHSFNFIYYFFILFTLYAFDSKGNFSILELTILPPTFYLKDKIFRIDLAVANIRFEE